MFYFPVDFELKRVCTQTFLAILGYPPKTNKIIQHVLLKYAEDPLKLGGMVDKWGKAEREHAETKNAR